jgi:hypothetical protein
MFFVSLIYTSIIKEKQKEQNESNLNLLNFKLDLNFLFNIFKKLRLELC